MSTKLADNPATEAAKKAVEAEKKISDKAREVYANRMKGKPTPTQAENDLAACGANILEHEADGSDPDTANAPVHERHLSAGGGSKPQTYSTRQSTAKSE